MGQRGVFHRGRATVAFGTVFTQTCPPHPTSYTRINTLSYTAAGTAHTITVMKPLNKCITAAAAAASQAVIVLATDPGLYAASTISSGGYYFGTISVADNAIATSDYVVVQYPDGTLQTATVTMSGLSATLAANVSMALPAGSTVWFYGITTDKNPVDNAAHATLPTIASTTLTFQDINNGITQSFRINEPVIFHSNNATATGVLDYLSGSFWFPGSD